MTNKEAIEHLRELKTLKIEFPNTLQEQALDLAIKALEAIDSQDYKDKRQYSGERTMFDDCYPCTNCQEFECDGCVYDLMHKGAEG